MLQIANRNSLVIWSRKAQIAIIYPELLWDDVQLADPNHAICDLNLFPIAIRIAMPILCTTSQNIEVFWDGSLCLISLVICDSRFKSQIAIPIKSHNLEHLGQHPSWHGPPNLILHPRAHTSRHPITLPCAYGIPITISCPRGQQERRWSTTERNKWVSSGWVGMLQVTNGLCNWKFLCASHP